MITLFLLPAATGFLFTATPKFLMTTPTKSYEIWVAAILYLLLFISFFFKYDKIFVLLKCVTLFWITIYFVRRWWKRKTKNPHWPPFILTSLFSGLMGCSVQVTSFFVKFDPLIILTGHHLYFNAMFWILLFGIGIKFFPMLTGAAPPVYNTNRKSLLSKTVYNSSIFWFFIAFFSISSFLIQLLVNDSAGLWIRAILIMFIAYEGWGLFEKPLRKGYTTFFLKIFLFTILLSHFIFPFIPIFIVHLYHLVFVTGFLSITIMVETRVLLSHENLDIVEEQKSIWILTGFILLFLTMITRVTAIFIPARYFYNLRYASILGVAGVILIVIQIFKSFINKAKIKD